ncbi:MAG: M28 family peptidase [Flavobacteriaceae bacterium]|nr:M28 family peptidase [Flavobacteriaceae bacterium]
MKKSIFILGVTALLIACGSSKESAQKTVVKTAPLDVTEFAKTITSTELKDMLYTYASDEFQGRETGEAGHEIAVNYIKDFYIKDNIAPLQANGSYFQDVKFKQLYTPEVNVNLAGKSLSYFTDIVSLSASAEASINANEIIYVGYGIDDENYSDYKNLNVKGKVVIAKEGEPANTDGTYMVSGTSEKSRWSSNGRTARSFKRDAAKANGAAAFLIVDDAAFNFYASIYKNRAESNSSLGLSLESNKDEPNEMLYMMITEATANSIEDNLLSSNTPKTLSKQITLNQKSNSKQMISKNVAAYVKGSEFPNEYIIISAHSDHVGVNDKGEVFNGADDDGSGSMAVLEIAEAFKAAVDKGQAPKRSVIFLHVTGEEKGLLGSQYYTDIDPLVPLTNTVANLNIDMIGRIDPKREGDRNYLYLIGSDKLSTELHNLSEEVNKKYTNIEFDYTYNDENDPNRFYYRSDHYNFAKNNIPIIFYFNGTHDDYHKVSDTPDKIEYDLLENRTRLVFYTAWELANRPARIVVDKAVDKTAGN